VQRERTELVRRIELGRGQLTGRHVGSYIDVDESADAGSDLSHGFVHASSSHTRRSAAVGGCR